MSACYPIIINKNNLVPGSTNQYRYNFSNNVDFSNIDIGLGSASVWFSWQNITANKGNNKFNILHPITGTGNATLNITIPDGGYEIADINNYLRYYLVSNGYYLRNNTTGDDTVYCEFKVNPSIYSVEFVTYPLPTSLPSNYTAGPSLTFPSTTRCPQLTVTQAQFGTVIGFATGTFPVVQPTTITSIASTFTPVVSDVTNVIITLDSANNPFAQNSGVIHSISPAGYKYAQLIRSDPSEIAWTPQQSGSRQSITLSLVSQDLTPIVQKDTDVTIKLLLRYNDQSKIYR